MNLRAIGASLMTVLVVSGCAGSGTAAIELVTPGEAARVLDREAGVVLLDVRTPEEYTELRLPDSVNIDYYGTDFSAHLEALPRDVPYVVYCRSGNRSSRTVQIMRDLGFTRVWEVDGGILAWAQAGLPLES